MGKGRAHSNGNGKRGNGERRVIGMGKGRAHSNGNGKGMRTGKGRGESNGKGEGR